MAGGGIVPRIPTADFKSSGQGSMPLSPDSNTTLGSDDVIVHFKIATTDPELTRRVTRVIMQQLEGQKVGERGISATITNESVEMSIVDKQLIAAQITPLVANALGVKLPV